MRTLFIFFLTSCSLFSQEKKYWMYFDTNCTDIETQIKAVKEVGGVYQRKSEWLNAASFLLTENQKSFLIQNDCVESISPVLSFTTQKYSALSLFTDQLKQIHGNALAENNLFGQGIKVGIIDAGFSLADKADALSHLFSRDQIKGYKDYVDRNDTDFFEAKTSSDSHGTSVWKLIAGKDSSLNRLQGLAQEASFYLARTEIGNKEQKIEEDHWIEAIEWMYKEGVQVVNSSLGYSNKFDDKSENHSQKDMNGKTTAISKAAQIASEKGMLLVISAGNLGHTSWQIISAPADAPGVISVGATKSKMWSKMNYSSIGPPSNDYLKPNVSSYSTNGTSFSSPVIAGLAACLWQKDTSLSNVELKKIIEQSSHLYPYGNNYLGYGVPNAKKAIAIIEKDMKVMMERPKYITCSKKRADLVLENEATISVVGFHKLNKHVVESQMTLELKKGKRKAKDVTEEVSAIVYRKNDAIFLQIKNNSRDIKYSSFSINNDKLYEVEWGE